MPMCEKWKTQEEVIRPYWTDRKTMWMTDTPMDSLLDRSTVTLSRGARFQALRRYVRDDEFFVCTAKFTHRRVTQGFDFEGCLYQT